MDKWLDCAGGVHCSPGLFGDESTASSTQHCRRQRFFIFIAVSSRRITRYADRVQRPEGHLPSTTSCWTRWTTARRIRCLVVQSPTVTHTHTHTRSMIYYYYHYYLIHMCVLYLRHGTTLFKKYNHFFNYLMCASPYHLLPLPTDQLNDQRKQHSFIQFSCTLT